MALTLFGVFGVIEKFIISNGSLAFAIFGALPVKSSGLENAMIPRLLFFTNSFKPFNYP